jgi:hypothetical protein
MPAVVISVKLEPRRLRTLETFEAPDPWNGGAPAAFDLDLHKLMPKRARVVREGSFWGKDVYALRSKGDGADRFLPESLSELWKTRRVATGALPRLLAEVEPGLRPGDFAPVLHLRFHRWLAAFFGLIAAACLGMAVRAAGTGGGHTTTRVPLAEWLARPQLDGEDLVTDRPVKTDGLMKVDFEPQLPPALFAYPANGSFVLAWVPASGGHRLLLAAEDQVAALPHLALTGVTLSPASIGLPAGALAEVKGRVPDVDTSLVTALHWTWTDIETPSRRVVLFFAGLAVVSGGGGAIIYLMIALRQARRRRQMTWLLARA